MSSVGYEHTIPASERSQTHALDRATNGTGFIIILVYVYIYIYRKLRAG